LDLKQIVPWGRSYDEYYRMFALSTSDLSRSILGCGDGPAAFNAVLTARGGRVISADPIYELGAGEIRSRIEETAGEVLRGIQNHRDRYSWAAIPNPEALFNLRMAAMNTFLGDYEAGRRSGRYVPASLPKLPFRDKAFDLALSSHLLFTYSPHLDAAFHQAATAEMVRVAREVRIFPLVALDGQPSPHLAPVREALAKAGHATSIEPVDYAFQLGGNQMIRITRRG